MGRSIIFLICFGVSLSALAQMTDLLGDLAIQGQLSAQSVKGYNTATLMNEKNNLAQELQIQLIDLQTKFLNNGANVSRETISSPFLKKYNTTVKKEKDSFCFELNHVDEKLCKSITSGFAGSYKIDNKNCQKVKIYYK